MEGFSAKNNINTSGIEKTGIKLPGAKETGIKPSVTEMTGISSSGIDEKLEKMDDFHKNSIMNELDKLVEKFSGSLEKIKMGKENKHKISNVQVLTNDSGVKNSEKAGKQEEPVKNETNTSTENEKQQIKEKVINIAGNTDVKSDPGTAEKSNIKNSELRHEFIKGELQQKKQSDNINLVSNSGTKSEDSSQKNNSGGAGAFGDSFFNKETRDFINIINSMKAEAKKTEKNSTEPASLRNIRDYGNAKLSQITNKTIQMVKNTSNNSVQKARLYLTPKSLGTVIVEIQMHNDIASLKIKADTKEVLKSIESQLPGLKEKLGQQGIKTDSVDIGLRNSEQELLGQNSFAGGSREDYSESEARKEFINSFGALSAGETFEADKIIDNKEDMITVRNNKAQGSSFERYI